jgi:integrase
MQDHSERPWPTREEVEDIVAAAEAPWDLAIRLIVETGLRRGELIGLRWGDLDLERRRLRVARSVGPHGENAPKSRAGARSIPLRRSMADALVAHRLAATRSDDRDPVFPHPGGGHQSPHALHRAWCRARRRAGAREELRLHSLRHYAASCFIRAGASVKTVQTAMGHSSATLTLDLYAHLFDADLDALADRLEAQDAQLVGTGRGAGQVVALGVRSSARL